MKHYDDQSLIDYARGTGNDPTTREIQTHLNGSCADCERRLRHWSRMTEFGIRESCNEPPAGAVRVMKAAFREVPVKARQAMREVATLVFDSFSQVPLAGVRSSAAAAERQLLYRAGPLMIDMKLQMSTGADRFSLVGQVLSSDDAIAMNEVPVHLLSGSSELASTSTNRFGEFRLEHDSEKDLHVSLEVSREKEVFIPLDEAIWRVAFGR
jgi:hypothetical protein